MAVLALTIGAVLFASLEKDFFKSFQVEAVQADEKEKDQKQEVFHFSGAINLDGMNKLPEELSSNAQKKFGVSKQKLDKTKLEMNLKLKPSDESGKYYDAEATGAFKFGGDRAHGYKAAGELSKVVNPENGEVYFSGEIRGKANGVNLNKVEKKAVENTNLNSGFLIVFNAKHPEDYYIASTIGYQSSGGTTIFGNKNVYANWEKAVEASGGKLNWQ